MRKAATGLKILLVVLIIVAMIASMTACANCILVIANNSSFDLDSVTWFGTSFGCIVAGSSNRQKIQPGTDYIYFYIAGVRMRTAYPLTCEKGYETTYRVTDLTPVYVYDQSLSCSDQSVPIALSEAMQH